MKFNKFEDIIAWQKGQDLAFEVYGIFRASRDFGFKDQIQRASVSISNNIAEGFDRMSNKEFIRFLYYAQGSCSEVKSMIYLAKRLEYIDQLTSNKIIKNTSEIGKVINGLIKSLRSQESVISNQ